MVSLKLAALLTVAAVVAFASSAVVNPTYDVAKENTTDGDKTELSTPGFIDDRDNKVDDASQAEIDGIPLRFLTEEELEDLLDEDDNITANELDIIVARKIVKARQDGNGADAGGNIYGVPKGGRPKRWIAIAARLLSAGRALFKGAARAPKPTVSGSRVTQQYTRPGNFNDANKHFNGFKPDNVKPFSKNGINGRTGTVGNHRITVRDGSKQGSPTLEIRSPRPNGEHVRKFRYDKK